MTYNIHPIFVHFPIALLLIYSILVIFPLSKFFPEGIKLTQRIFLALGFLGGVLANITGEMAEHLVKPQRDIVEMHSFFAFITLVTYGIIIFGEILIFVEEKYFVNKDNSFIKNFIIKIKEIITYRIVSIILAILGLIFISITGLLGGVIVYGITADPVAPFILKLLGISVG